MSNAASIRVWPDCEHKIARPLGLYFALPRAESLSPVLFAFITYSTRATFEMSFTPAGSPAAPWKVTLVLPLNVNASATMIATS